MIVKFSPLCIFTETGVKKYYKSRYGEERGVEKLCTRILNYIRFYNDTYEPTREKKNDFGKFILVISCVMSDAYVAVTPPPVNAKVINFSREQRDSGGIYDAALLEFLSVHS